MSIYPIVWWLKAKLHSSQRGASLVEYMLLVSLIAVLALVAVQTFGHGVSTKFSTIDSQIR